MNDILAYQIDLPDEWDPQYLCVDCGAESNRDWDYFDGVDLIPITDAATLPDGPSGLGYSCDSPFCNDRLPTKDDLERAAQILREARDQVFGKATP